MDRDRAAAMAAAGLAVDLASAEEWVGASAEAIKAALVEQQWRARLELAIG